MAVQATATLQGEIDNETAFTMYQNGTAIGEDTSIMIGTSVHFTAKVPGATRVQLIVDNIEYEEYRVVNGEVSFSRVFSKAGIRSVRFHIMKIGEFTYSSFTPSQTLNIDLDGTLSKPLVHSVGKYFLNNDDPLVISWDMKDHDHTASYRVYLYYVDHF